MVRLVPKSDILTESLSHIRILWEERGREGKEEGEEGRGGGEGEKESVQLQDAGVLGL